MRTLTPVYQYGNIIPGDVNGSVTAEEHNLNGDDAFVQANSPYTSWFSGPGTYDSAVAQAGQPGNVTFTRGGQVVPNPFQ
jgi:hypothetical protein